MLKFPQLFLLLALAVPAQADAILSVIPPAVAAVPEPGVFVALISGAAMLLARRRRH